MINYSCLLQNMPKSLCITGTSVEAQVHGKRYLKLVNHGETYEMNCPHLLIRTLPLPATDWAGNVTVRCPQTTLVAELTYKTQSFLGPRANHRLIQGKIFNSSSFKVLYELHGHWDRYLSSSQPSISKLMPFTFWY